MVAIDVILNFLLTKKEKKEGGRDVILNIKLKGWIIF